MVIEGRTYRKGNYRYAVYYSPADGLFYAEAWDTQGRDVAATKMFVLASEAHRAILTKIEAASGQQEDSNDNEA